MPAGAGVCAGCFRNGTRLGILGYVYLEKGEVTQAIPVLESAVQAAQQYRSQQVQSWFKVFLGEAYRMNNQLEQAQDLSMQGLELARRIKYPWDIVSPKARSDGSRIPAATSPPRQRISSTPWTPLMPCRHDTTWHEHISTWHHSAHTQENQDAATMHLSTAYAWFKKLQVPKWVERTEQLAQEYGVTLAEVVLEELTEGEP